MRFYSAHLKADAEPIVMREGFSWGAFLFGPLWFAMHRAWIAAVITLAASIVIVVTAGPLTCAVLLLGLAIALGLTGHDIWRWALEQRGYLLMHVFATRDADEALLRLIDQRPDLADRYRPEPR